MDYRSATITHGIPIVYEASGTSSGIINPSQYNKPLFTIPVGLLEKLSNEDKEALSKEVQATINKYEEIAIKSR